MSRLMIAIPCLDTVSATFVSCLNDMLGSGTIRNVAVGYEVQSLVYESRNALTGKALAGGFDRILWLDSDMCFEPDLAARLSKDMDEGRDFVSAVYFRRKLPTQPLIYKKIEWYKDDDGWAQSYAEPYINYPPNSVFRISGCGFGAVMMKTSLLADVLLKYKTPPFTPMSRLSEDLALCWRLEQMDIPMYADSSINAGHCGLHVYTAADWMKQEGKSDGGQDHSC